MLRIRTAKKSEMPWIDSCYNEVNFMQSNFDNEVIAIAELDGQKVGLGRLVTIDEENRELGGVYVFEPFQGRGIAGEIVKFLLTFPLPYQNIYCIAFEHLIPFYMGYGFISCHHFEEVPKEILKKLQWCSNTYSAPTGLLVLKTSDLKNRRSIG